MAIVKQSNTTKIFEKNNFGKFLPILSNENVIEKLIGSKKSSDENSQFNDFLKKRRLPIGKNDIKIELNRISELLQSISVYGKFTNEILHEFSDMDGLGASFQICYLKSDEYLNLKNTQTLPDFINPIGITEMLGNTKRNNSINSLDNVLPINSGNNFPYLRERANPGLSVIQVLNPELRGCYKNTQELDLFFNMLSTLDISLAIPYVNADFLIPKKISRNITEGDGRTSNNDKNYLTTSLNNFILGDEYFTASQDGKTLYDGITDTAKAINGDFYSDEYSIIRNNINNNSGKNSQIKKTYHRQIMNNAIFFAPQTMVNGDYNIAGNPNALIDKFRPFMSILDLSFDVRPTKGLLYYKTATLNLILYDKARMSQIAPFIKPELLNSVSSEIILEYGWQSNLGDNAYNNPKIVSIGNQEIEYMENPIAEFMNSLKVKEKYIIVNSSYTINANGTVNINLNLAMKGASELRGLVFNYDTSVMEMKTKLNQFIDNIKDTAHNQVFTEETTPDERGRVLTSEMTGISDLHSVVADLKIDNLDDNKLNSIQKSVTDFFGTDTTNKLLLDLNSSIEETKKNLKLYVNRSADYIENNFPFFKEHDASKNDAFVDWDWWNNNLTYESPTDSTPVTEQERGSWKKNEWISLGKILTCIVGYGLSTEDGKYDEIQFVFYTLNSKAIQASFLNIASVPVNLSTFKKKLETLIQNSTKISKEGMIEFILNLAVNQKAAAVFGLGKYFEFTENNSSRPILKNTDGLSESEKSQAHNEQSRAVQGEIFKQYYGTTLQEKDANSNPVFANSTMQQLHEICGGVYDLTFNVPKVVMNFDSMFHENDPNSSILRISFYDEHDNPFESVTEYMTNFHKSEYKQAVSPLAAVRSLLTKSKTLASKIQSEIDTRTTKPAETSADIKLEEKPLTTEQISLAEKTVNQRLRNNINDVIYKMILDKLIVLKDDQDQAITIPQINPNNPLINVKKIMINVNNRDKIKNFTSMKSFFKTYMPSLTFGQVNSALISGNVTTNQDPKYSTVQLFRQDGEINQNEILPYNFELFNQSNNTPMMVMPAQASVQIVGCPIVNFSQLLFLDFNTGTSIDNMYFITGIKHSISPGRFTTDLTLSQRDIYSQFMAEAGVIQEFFKAIDKFKGISLKSKDNPSLPVAISVPKADNQNPPIKNNDATNIRYQLIFKINHHAK